MRYFKFVKYNGDLSGLFKSNSPEVIEDQRERMRYAMTSLLEISKEEYERIELEID